MLTLTSTDAEFGAKVHLCIEDGLSRVDHASFEAYDEATRLTEAAEGYRRRHGAYPGRILADKIYLNRENRACCKVHGGELAGPKLGRPPKDPKVAREDRRRERQAASDRNCVEGAFGAMKGSYGMDRVMTMLEETTETAVAMAVLSFSMKKLMGLLHALIQWAVNALRSFVLIPEHGNRLLRA